MVYPGSAPSMSGMLTRRPLGPRPGRVGEAAPGDPGRDRFHLFVCEEFGEAN